MWSATRSPSSSCRSGFKAPAIKPRCLLLPITVPQVAVQREREDRRRRLELLAAEEPDRVRDLLTRHALLERCLDDLHVGVLAFAHAATVSHDSGTYRSSGSGFCGGASVTMAR